MAEERIYKREELGEPLFSSRSSEVFAWEGEEKLLKLFCLLYFIYGILDVEMNFA